MAILIQEPCGSNTATKRLKDVGFVAVGPEWPSTYYHKEMKLLLVVYVDDLKMAGPESSMKQGWALLRSKLDLEPETDLGFIPRVPVSAGRNQT